jgi:hypothetical protein
MKIILLVCFLFTAVNAVDQFQTIPGFAVKTGGQSLTTPGTGSIEGDLDPFTPASVGYPDGKLEVQWGSDFDGGFVNGEVYWQQQRNRKGTTNNITTTNNTITSNNRWSL